MVIILLKYFYVRIKLLVTILVMTYVSAVYWCCLQVDIEMSFIDQAGIMRLTEELLAWAWPEEKGLVSSPFPQMTYQHAMTKYGIDKPDTRFNMLVSVIEIVF